MLKKFKETDENKVGPKLIIVNGVKNPVIGVKSPQLSIYKAIYRGYNTHF